VFGFAKDESKEKVQFCGKVKLHKLTFGRTRTSHRNRNWTVSTKSKSYQHN